MTILITGGHITPALAVIGEIRQRFPTWKLILVGRQFSLEKEKIHSEEERLAKQNNLEFIPLATGRFTRTFSITTFLSLFKIQLGFLHAIRIVASVRPNIILSFGGYIALPLIIAGKLFRIRVVTHEQTRVPGLANRIISLFADKVCVSFPDQKGVYTGLPIRKEIFEHAKKPEGIDVKRPLLFFTGGSTGSQSLNDIISRCIPLLTKRFMVVHQTGRLSKTKPVRYYIPLPYIDIPEYAWILQNAKLVIGRSGANTVGELATLGKVAIWIPLPWSGGGEQLENARYLEKNGTSVVLHQSSITPGILLQTIDEVLENYSRYEQNARILSRTIRRDAASRIVDILSKL